MLVQFLSGNTADGTLPGIHSLVSQERIKDRPHLPEGAPALRSLLRQNERLGLILGHTFPLLIVPE